MGKRSEEHLVARWLATAFAVGFAATLATSGSIAWNRVTGGTATSALAANVVETIVAVVAVLATMGPLRIAFAQDICEGRVESVRRVRKGVLLAAQGVGAAAAIAVVHWGLRSLVVGSAPWLCEQPPQLMNDAVAAAALLCLVWACASDLDLLLLGLALAVLTLYGATGPAWHLDHAPKPPLISVQNLIVMQWTSVALALGLVRSTLGAAGHKGTPPR